MGVQIAEHREGFNHEIHEDHEEGKLLCGFKMAAQIAEKAKTVFFLPLRVLRDLRG
jgi:hypothetical protein